MQNRGENDETDQFVLNKIKLFERKIEELILTTRDKELKMLAIQNDIKTVNMSL